MNKKEYLRMVRKQIQFIFDRDSIEAELNQHLLDSMADLMEDGLPEEEAELQAVAQMGDPVAVGKLLNQEHHPLLGYLLMASRVALLLLVYPAFILVIGLGGGLLKNVTPERLEKAVETYPLRMEMELPTHKVKLDNISVHEDGRYYLTYRAWTKFGYSRSSISLDFFQLENCEGKGIEGGGTVQ